MTLRNQGETLPAADRLSWSGSVAYPLTEFAEAFNPFRPRNVAGRAPGGDYACENRRDEVSRARPRTPVDEEMALAVGMGDSEAPAASE
jgi:hypothetical protein